MISKLIIKYKESVSPLLLREFRLVANQKKICFWEIILPIVWLLYLALFSWNSVGLGGLTLSCNSSLCWLTVILTLSHYFCLAPRLAASVAADRRFGVYKMLSITPSGCQKSLAFKILAFSGIYWIEWSFISISSLVFSLFSSNLNGEIAISISVYSALSLLTAISLGIFWGIIFQNSSVKCAASLRKLLIATAAGAYYVINWSSFSQIEGALLLSGLLLVLWGGTIYIVYQEMPIALALLLLSLSFIPGVHQLSWPFYDCLNPVRICLVNVYSLDREALQTDNIASAEAYPTLQKFLAEGDSALSLKKLLHLYSEASQVSREQIYAQVRSEAETSLFQVLVTHLVIAFALAVGSCCILPFRLVPSSEE